MRRLLFLSLSFFLSMASSLFSMELTKESVSSDERPLNSEARENDLSLVIQPGLSFKFFLNNLPREKRKIMKKAVREAIKLISTEAQNCDFEVLIQGFKIVCGLFPQIHKMRFGAFAIEDLHESDEQVQLQELYLQDEHDDVSDEQKILDKLEALGKKIDAVINIIDECFARHDLLQKRLERILEEGEETKRQYDRSESETRAEIKSLKENQEDLGMNVAGARGSVEKANAGLDETKKTLASLQERLEASEQERKEQKESLDKRLETLANALQESEKKQQEQLKRGTRNLWIGLGVGALIAGIALYAYHNFVVTPQIPDVPVSSIPVSSILERLTALESRPQPMSLFTDRWFRPTLAIATPQGTYRIGGLTLLDPARAAHLTPVIGPF